jgi:hypothetical protein
MFLLDSFETSGAIHPTAQPRIPNNTFSEMFFFVLASRPTVGHTQPPMGLTQPLMQWVSGAL